MVKSITKATALAAARRRWGKRAYIEERRNAPTAEEREAAEARSREIGARVQAITKELAAMPDHHAALCKAARFVVDVNGDDPSIPQLRAAVEAAEYRLALIDEKAELRAEREQLRCHSYRWEVGYTNYVGDLGFCHVGAKADTLAELMEKIEPATA